MNRSKRCQNTPSFWNQIPFNFHILHSLPPNCIDDICHSKSFADHLAS
uniref:Uncharacterized protein MANES_02G099000 n=1 Tax=Rhizophora mucronata TaxID=61149 RepID=A0A2P2MQ00_RHIMU